MNSIFDYTKYYLFFIVVVFIVTSCGGGGGTQYNSIPEPTSGDSTVVEVTEFNNDFNNLTGLNTTAPQAPYANESQTYSPNNVSVVTSPSATANSVNTLNYSTQSTSTPETYLQILATTNSGTVTSGYVSTQGFQEFQYGRVEARIKIPNNTAVVPRFSLIGESFSTTVNIPTAGALDIMQVGSDTKTITPQLYGANPSSTPVLRNESLADGFRVYSVDWTTDKMIVKESGTVLHTFDIANDPRFQQEFFVALSIGVPTGNTLVGTATMLVDWLKVYPNETQDNTGFLGDDNSTKVSATTVETTNSNVSVNTSANNVGGVTPLQGESYIAVDFNTTEAGAGASLKVNATDYSQKTNVNFAINTSQMSNLASMKVTVYNTNSSATISTSEITPAVVTMDTSLANNVNNSNPLSTLNTSSGTTGWNNYSIPLRNFTQANNTFDFSNFTGIGFSDPVDANGQPVTGSLLVDNLQMAETILIGLPLDFELSSSSYNLSEANGGGISIVDMPQRTAGVNISDNVVKITQSADNAEVSVLLDSAIDLSSNKYFTLKVKASRATPIKLTLQNPDNPSQTGSVTGQYTYPNSGAWEKVLFDFSNVANAVGSNAKKIIIKFDNGSDNDFDSTPANWTFYADDLEQHATPPEDALKVPSTAPVSLGASRTISIYSDEYTDISRDLTQDNGQATILTEEIYVGNNVLKLKDFDSQVIDFQDNKQDVTTYDKFYFNYWTPNVNSFNSFLISIDGVQTETAYAVSTSSNSWQSVDIDTSHFADGGVDLTKISQLKFNTSHTPTGIVYLDNIYFYDSSTLSQFDGGLLTNGDFQSGVNPWSGNQEGGPEIKDDGANKYFYANPTNSGKKWDVNLEQAVNFPADAVYTLTFKAKSDVSRSIEAGIGINFGDYSPNDIKVVNLTNSWQTYTYSVSSNGFDSDDNRVFFQFGDIVGDVSIDDVALFAADSTTPTNTVTLPVGFDQDYANYSIDQFGNATFAITADPSDANNKVLQMTRPVNTEWWSGGFLELTSGTDATQGAYSMKVYSTEALAYVELKLEQDGNNHTVMSTTHDGTGWETLTFDAASGVVTGAPTNAIKVVFTPRVTSDGSHAAPTADQVFYFDDIQEGTPEPTGPTVTLPVGFDQDYANYSIDQFGNATFAITADPSDANNKVLQMTRPVNTEWWSGGFLELTSGTDATQGAYSMKVYSTEALAYVELKLEQDGNNHTVMSTTHDGTGWETLTFDAASGVVTGAPTNAIKVVFTPRVTSDGSHAAPTADQVFYFDDIQEGTPEPTGPTVTLPVGFDQDYANYSIDQFGNATFAITADPSDANNKVLQMTRPVNTEWWSGGFLELTSGTDATQGAYSMKVYSTEALAYVELKLEQDGNNHTVMSTTHDGTGWETLTFDAASGVVTGAPTNAIKVVFTPRVTSDGSHAAPTADQVFYFDDIQEGTPEPTGPTVTLPVGFDQDYANYSIDQFGNATFAITADPSDANNKVLQMTRPVNTEWWSGGFLELTSGTDATQGAYSMKVYSTEALAYVELKLEQDGNNHTVMSTTHDGTGWETLTFDAASGVVTGAPTNAIKVVFTPRVTSDGSHAAPTADQVFYFDDIQEGTPEPTGPTVTLPVGFDQDYANYSIDQFGNATFAITADPSDANNKVLQMTRPVNTEWWSGGFLELTSGTDATQGAYSMKVYSTEALAYVELKLEQDGNNHTVMSTTHDGTGWETLTFDAASGVVTGAPTNAIKVVFTPRVTSDGSHAAPTADQVFYFDDIQEGTPEPTGPTVTLPVGFDQDYANYSIDQFGNATFAITADPSDANNKVLQMTRPVNTEWWSGGFLELTSGTDATQGAYSMKVYSTEALAYVELKLEQDGNNHTVMSTTHDGTGWETLTFDAASGVVTGAPTNAIKVVFTPRVTSDGSHAAPTADQVFYFDDIQEGTPEPTGPTVTLPVGFDQDYANYSIDQFGNATFAITADPSDANNKVLQMTRPVNTEWWSGGFLELTSGTDATQGAYSMKVYSTEALAYVELKLEQDGNNHTVMSTTHDGTGWETLTFDAASGVVTGAPTNAIKVVFTPRVTSDGSHAAPTADQVFYFDDIQEGTPEPTGPTVTLPVGFDQDYANYSIDQFGNATFAITADPSDANNKVLQMTRPVNTEWWSGGFLELTSGTDATQGAYSMKVYSTEALAYVELKLEQDGNNHTVMSTTHDGTGWETLTFDAASGVVTGAPTNAIKVVFTPRVTSDGSHAAPTADQVFYFDDIQEGTPEPTGPTVTLPVGFDQDYANYSIDQFGNATFAITADPSDANNKVLQMTRPVNTEWWSGGFLELTSGTDATQGAYSMKVYSTEALAYVELKLEQDGNNHTVMSTTHDGTGWETLTFDAASGVVTGAPTNAIKVVFTPRVTSDGSHAAPTADQVFYFDDIQEGTPEPTGPTVTLPVGFDQDYANYSIDQFGNATFAITADPSDANNKVLQMTRPVNTEWWSGGFLELTSGTDATQGAYSMKVYSTEALAYVELKLEQDGNNHTVMSTTHDGTGWETLTFDAASGVVTGAPTNAIKVVFTPRVTSDGSHAAPTADQVFYFDDIQEGTPEPTGPTVTLPVGFDQDYANYSIDQFGNATFAITADPSDANNKVLQMTRPVNTEWWSGGFLELTSGTDATQGAYSMKVYSTEALAYVELKLEQDGNNHTVMSTTHDGTGWETLTFDAASGVVTGAPTNAIKVVFTPRVTSDGSHAAPTADQVFYFDDIQEGASPLYQFDTLNWSDEFNNSTLDTNNWNYETGYGLDNSGWGNNERQNYTDSPDNLSIENDPNDPNNKFLKITARCSDGNCGVRDGSVTSARINTKDKFSVQYGRIEARIKVPNGDSTWPAFWMLGDTFDTTKNKGWPQSGEIDIMEVSGEDSINKSIFAIHWDDNGRQLVTQTRDNGSPLSDDFHVYATEWDSTKITGYIDGIQYFERNITSDAMSEFHQNFFLILNVAIDGTLGGEPNQIKTTPQEMLVDWVRVYK